jgi:hypothetical protein
MTEIARQFSARRRPRRPSSRFLREAGSGDYSLLWAGQRAALARKEDASALTTRLWSEAKALLAAHNSHHESNCLAKGTGIAKGANAGGRFCRRGSGRAGAELLDARCAAIRWRVSAASRPSRSNASKRVAAALGRISVKRSYSPVSPGRRGRRQNALKVFEEARCEPLCEH